MGKLGDLIDVLKKVKRTQPRTQLCPKCGSHKMTAASSLSDWLTPLERECNACGYVGPIYLEIEVSDQLINETERRSSNQ